MKRKECLNHLFENISKSFLRFIFLFLLINSALPGYSQEITNEEKEYHLTGLITATNNGISVIPSFSLGKPAFMFEFSMGGDKITFDPQLRFSMKGKPWSFVFWWRYHMIQHDKFRFRIGAHPAFMFADLSYEDEGQPVESIGVRRFIAGEIAPTFQVSEKVAIMPYTIIGHGFDEGVKNSFYLTLITSISDLGITDNVRFSIVPQVFFLRMDGDHGYYCASSFTLSHYKLPVYLASMVNYKINSQIASADFLWNVSLVYAFSSNFKKLKN